MEKNDKIEQNMHINWYPGHMKKTKEQIIENMKLVDVAIELVDARAPFSSSNPDIDEMVKRVPKIIVLNKEDLANPEDTQKWLNYYKKQGIEAVKINAVTGAGLRDMFSTLERASHDLYEKLQKKGRRKRALRVIIVGIPNVGKSSLINRMVGKKSAKTGDRPGVTKGKQWIKMKGDFELLDTPGVLWPKIENQESALKLAYLGSIRDQTMEIEEIATSLIQYLWKTHKEILIEKYDIQDPEVDFENLLNQMAQKRGYLLSGGRVDYTRLSNSFLLDFRSGKLGRITLENPEITEGE